MINATFNIYFRFSGVDLVEVSQFPFSFSFSYSVLLKVIITFIN